MSWMRAAAMVALAAASLAAAAGGAPQSGLGPVPWQELKFSAHKFLMSAETTVRVDRVRGEDLARVLRRATGAVRPQGTGGAVHLELDTDLPMGRHETAAAWIDPVTGAALQREKLVTGSRNYWKLHRYTRRGIEQWRAEPANGAEERLAAEGWSKRRQNTYTWSAPRPPHAAVTDPYALLYLLSAARLDRPGASLSILVASKERLVELSFASEDLLRHEVGFDEQAGGETRRRTGPLAVRRVTGSARYLGSEERADDVDTGFMGMQGGITVLLEEGTGLPVEVSGRSKGIGRLEVALERVVLR